MRAYGRLAAAILLLGSTILGTGAPASAAATGSEYCSIVIDELRPGQQVSEVVSKTCASSPAVTSAAVSDQSVPLIRLYQHAGFQGEWTDIYGDEGPCDAEGYGISTTFWNAAFGISSYRVYNACSYSMAWDRGPGGDWDRHGWDFCWDVSYVGSEVNDRVNYINLSNSSWCV
jgi:hypothetical protein